MNINQMRSFVIKAYPGNPWMRKVSIMPDNQIIAIYYNILTRKEVSVTVNDNEDIGKAAQQLSMFDIY